MPFRKYLKKWAAKSTASSAKSPGDIPKEAPEGDQQQSEQHDPVAVDEHKGHSSPEPECSQEPLGQHGPQIVNEYVYTPLPEPDYIRILSIQPAAELNEEIRCTIRTSHITDGGYNALSYTWGMNDDGDATLCRSILVEDERFHVTRNLFEGLRRIRRSDTALDIWIDAVCINQQDVEERSDQVSRMATIFANTDEVFVWLGEGHEALDRAFLGFLQRLQQHQGHERFRRGFQHPPDCVYAAILDISMDCHTPGEKPASCTAGVLNAIWTNIRHPVPLCLSGRSSFDRRAALFDIPKKVRLKAFTSRKAARFAAAMVYRLLDRRYFTRLWTVQELYHAASVRWCWGACSWPADSDFCDWLTAIEDLQLFTWAYLTPSATWHYDRWKNHSLLLRQGRARAHLSQELPLAEAVYTYHQLEASDPRDRVFALASMCEPRIEVDYSSTVAQVATSFSKTAIEQGRWKAMLFSLFLQTRPAPFPLLLQPRRAPRDLSLPSWVVDLRAGLSKRGTGADASPHSELHVAVEADESISCQVHCLGRIEFRGSGLNRSIWLNPVQDPANPSAVLRCLARDRSQEAYQCVEEGGDCSWEWENIADGDFICSTFKEGDANEPLLNLRSISPHSDDLSITSVLIAHHLPKSARKIRKTPGALPVYTVRIR